MSSDALINAAQTNSQGSVGEDALAADGAANGKARHLAVPGAGGKKKAVARKPTTCACGLEGKHYTETALDAVFPSTPEKIYNLMFTSGFSKDFMSGNQKLMGESKSFVLGPPEPELPSDLVPMSPPQTSKPPTGRPRALARTS